jgi:hypothetical protein
MYIRQPTATSWESIAYKSPLETFFCDPEYRAKLEVGMTPLIEAFLILC